MKTAKKSSGGAEGALNDLIPEAVALSAQIETLTAQLDGKREAIKATMLKAKLKRFASSNGGEALIIDAEILTWDAEKLGEVLPEEIFEKMCPRKPNGTDLRKLLEIYKGNPDLAPKDVKEFRSCAKAKKQKRLEVRAPVAAGATNVEVAADKAA